MLEIIIGAIANLLTRFLPFIFLKRYSKKFLFLKDELPVVLLTILTLYTIFPTGEVNLNELKFRLIGIIVTSILHLFFRQFLLSVFVGSFCYILLINF
ncbi:Branched-chain amino acid transport protein AzlD [Desulfonauticus submarinus]|uniref:Branched-chain amino acid transport protein AzlD n=1 Tax=Desulfonauticus submarinus TaxID=206665 RepID=A0A1H0FMB7_9BACT|nr:AzlD domain-containing protein [Desulfonauticus submarinus]SDN95777.1 Branched-chain amino acid transport protein AzlD [Desulfonauticus submarinus]